MAGEPIYYLVHPDDLLERGHEAHGGGGLEDALFGDSELLDRFIEEARKHKPNLDLMDENAAVASLLRSKRDWAEQWAAYALQAKERGIFIPIFKARDRPSLSRYGDFYRQLQQPGESQGRVFPIYDDFSIRGAELPKALFALESLLGRRGEAFSEREHFIAGAYSNDCIALVGELLVFGVGRGAPAGSEARARRMVQAMHSSRVSPDNLYIIRQLSNPSLESVDLVNYSGLLGSEYDVLGGKSISMRLVDSSVIGFQKA